MQRRHSFEVIGFWRSYQDRCEEGSEVPGSQIRERRDCAAKGTEGEEGIAVSERRPVQGLLDREADLAHGVLLGTGEVAITGSHRSVEYDC